MGIQLAPIPDPRLPPELERPVFECAALSCPTTIPNLMLVAWRVKSWYATAHHVSASTLQAFHLCKIEPLLCRVVLLGTRTRPRSISGVPVFISDLRVIQTKPAEFLQQSVKHLVLTGDISASAAEPVLAACTGVVSLFALYSTSTQERNALARFQCLQRLTIGVDDFIRMFPIDDKASAVVHTLTHLELFGGRFRDFGRVDDPDAAELAACIGRLTHLTHVAFNCPLANNRFYATLRSHPRIECIVCLSLGHSQLAAVAPLADDDRFMCIGQTQPSYEGWIRGADGGDDHWALGDGFVAAKRAGRIDREFSVTLIPNCVGRRYSIDEIGGWWKI